jgi:hypothetical protein
MREKNEAVKARRAKRGKSGTGWRRANASRVSNGALRKDREPLESPAEGLSTNLNSRFQSFTRGYVSAFLPESFAEGFNGDIRSFG